MEKLLALTAEKIWINFTKDDPHSESYLAGKLERVRNNKEAYSNYGMFDGNNKEDYIMAMSDEELKYFVETYIIPYEEMGYMPFKGAWRYKKLTEEK